MRLDAGASRGGALEIRWAGAYRGLARPQPLQGWLGGGATPNTTLHPVMPARMPATERQSYHLSHLRTLEAEAVHVMREVAAEFERPVLLFSSGKDSIVLLRLAEKAFRPAGFPFPVMHVDTGHNFPEALEFRDRRMREIGEPLIVASVEESIRRGRVVEETGPRACT